MNTVKKNIKSHLFICCRSREEKSCCEEKRATELVKKLKKWTRDEGLSEQVKVSSSSCLGLCEKGITACLYPQNQWFTDIQFEDEIKLQQQILKSLSQL